MNFNIVLAEDEIIRRLRQELINQYTSNLITQVGNTFQAGVDGADDGKGHQLVSEVIDISLGGAAMRTQIEQTLAKILDNTLTKRIDAILVDWLKKPENEAVITQTITTVVNANFMAIVEPKVISAMETLGDKYATSVAENLMNPASPDSLTNLLSAA